ncbi:MAG TPA: prepilin-type N-terminal cleavage/methylation domain-containing protein [Candidatus Saccharimonadales bacterium]|jgi:prepilin-type N-terminal cleavage/methylation domain-containing protein|nr:prepilin-type N-terminal cleavage/methylation domain-containing protein [Candidatus Saccharimonadales bacterium]
MKKNRFGSKGFTIVELLVTIAVAGILIGTLSEVVNNYLHLGQRGRYLNLANSYVEAKSEALRNIGYNSLNLGTTTITSELPSQLPPSRNATMTISSPMIGLKQVDITVSYTDQAQNNSYKYTTYIGELGVGQ